MMDRTIDASLRPSADQGGKLPAEAAKLEAAIEANLEELGYGG